MKLSDIPPLKNGQICLVAFKSRGIGRIERRVFKWTEKRFGTIPCYLFSAPVIKPRGDRHIRVTWNAAEKSLEIAGPKVPCSEISVPHYDLTLLEPVHNAVENLNTWKL